MINVQKRPLRTFKEDAAPFHDLVVKYMRGVCYMGRESLTVINVLLHHLIGIQRSGA